MNTDPESAPVTFGPSGGGEAEETERDQAEGKDTEQPVFAQFASGNSEPVTLAGGECLSSGGGSAVNLAEVRTTANDPRDDDVTLGDNRLHLQTSFWEDGP